MIKKGLTIITPLCTIKGFKRELATGSFFISQEKQKAVGLITPSPKSVERDPILETLTAITQIMCREVI